MKYLKSTIFILICALKQQEVEIENERLKGEKELAEKETTEKEAEEAAKQLTAKELNSEETIIADLVSIIVMNLVEDGEMDDTTYDYIVSHHDFFPGVTVDSKNAEKMNLIVRFNQASI